MIFSKQQKAGDWNLRWLAKMAWRDSRRNYLRLMLFVSSILLGIAALVAIYSLSDNLRDNIDSQAASLLGADLEISSGRQIDSSLLAKLGSAASGQAAERRFASMVYFPKTKASRLVQIRSLEGAFPFYGSLEAIPAAASDDFRGQQAALADQSLLLQFGAVEGDSVSIGDLSFKIAGALVKAPGQTGLSASVAPVVYIPARYLERTGLEQKGSRINHRYYFKFNGSGQAEALLKELEPGLEAGGYDYETIESQKQKTGRSFRDLSRFLGLAAFIALLLGCIGVASAVHIYIKEKIGTIAVLRCLGVKSGQAFCIYLIQMTGLGLLGSIAGAALGTLIQQVMPLILKDLLPIEISTPVVWSAILQGIALGVLVALLFSLIPLIRIRKISPLNTLRLSVQDDKVKQDALSWVVYFLIASFIFIFTYLQLDDIAQTFAFMGGLAGVFLSLAGIASLLRWLMRLLVKNSWNFLWRQASANLYRPNNQTLVLILSIGLGTFFISTLFLVQDVLLGRLTMSGGVNQPNIVLFDIQTTQRQKLDSLVAAYGLPVTPTVPIVNMRLEQVKKYDLKDSSLQSDRLFSREYRVTYRDSLSAFESITEGKWQGDVASSSGTVYISLEKDFARRNHLHINDTLLFNIQGAVQSTVIGSFREVDWNRLQTNFLVVFPKGVLEPAPQFHVMLTRVPDAAISARFQQALVTSLPNISIIDLALVLKILDDIVGKISFVIRFIAGFSIFTGLIVLIASVLISKFQRMKESVLLRTLGASRKQIFIITALEYFFLGTLAAATGILLSFGAAWGLARYSFETAFNPSYGPVAVLFAAIVLSTVMIGLFNSREVITRPPLQILSDSGG